jgi:ankyrin repeat protein
MSFFRKVIRRHLYKNLEDFRAVNCTYSLEKLRALLKEDPDLVFRRDVSGWTALHLTADNPLTDVARLLLANKADINARDCNGWTPLHVAVEFGTREMVELLLANGAEVNATDNGECTPLDWALMWRKKEIAELLRQNGGCTKFRD